VRIERTMFEKTEQCGCLTSPAPLRAIFKLQPRYPGALVLVRGRKNRVGAPHLCGVGKSSIVSQGR
jgi:hypothetical protein